MSGDLITNDNALSPTAALDGLTWGGVRTAGQRLTVNFDTIIDEAVSHLSDFNNAAGGCNESFAIVLDWVITNLNDAITDGRVEIILLSPEHNIDAVDGQLQGSETTSAISMRRITEAFTTFGIEDTGAGDVSVAQIRFAFEADINSATVCFARGVVIETREGPVAVEQFRKGMYVRTLDAGFQPICWIGWMRLAYACASSLNSLSSMPVRVV